MVLKIQQTKLNSQNTRCKIQIEHPGTQEEQMTLDQVKPPSANFIVLYWSLDTNAGSLFIC